MGCPSVVAVYKQAAADGLFTLLLTTYRR